MTLTIAHHALLENHRAKTIQFMWLTVLLGVVFLGVQGYEYFHAYHEMNLKLSSGVYGSTFFMLTGFHGFHVFVGMLMLFFITLRLQKGHFSADRHFGFEGAAWYWHFVDVVWPDHIHKVPIPGGTFKSEMAISGEVPFLQTQCNKEQHQHADKDVKTMKTGKHEEGGTVYA